MSFSVLVQGLPYELNVSLRLNVIYDAPDFTRTARENRLLLNYQWNASAHLIEVDGVVPHTPGCQLNSSPPARLRETRVPSLVFLSIPDSGRRV